MISREDLESLLKHVTTEIPNLGITVGLSPPDTAKIIKSHLEALVEIERLNEARKRSLRAARQERDNREENDARRRRALGY